jgi:hypothetical protein
VQVDGYGEEPMRRRGGDGEFNSAAPLGNEGMVRDHANGGAGV